MVMRFNGHEKDPVPQLNAYSGAQQKLQINSSSNVLPSLDGNKGHKQGY